MKFTVRNPLDENWYADPEARCYNGKYYIYVTHSLPFKDQHNHTCFVSEDLTNWEKIENIIDMSGFPWAKCAIWAPTIEEKDGKLLRTRDGATTAFAYCGGTRFLSYDPEKDYDQGVRHEFLIRDGKAWAVRCGTRVFERMET